MADLSEKVKVLALYVLLETFNSEVKNIALNVPEEDYKRFEFIRVLGGGNLEFPSDVLEIARENLYRELPQYNFNK